MVRPIMQYFAERTPGTYIESKESSLAWHYRDADPHFGAWQAKDMQIHMEDVMSTLPLEIIQGNRLVEVRHVGVNKSAGARGGPAAGPAEQMIHHHQFVGRTLQHRKYQRRTSTLCSVWATTERRGHVPAPQELARAADATP